MKKLHELPKDILLQLLINVNNLSLMSDDELHKRQKMISDEITRRTHKTRCEVIKKSLLQLQVLPHLKEFIIENIEIINSIESVSELYIIINRISYSLPSYGLFKSEFLRSLSSFKIVPNVCSKSLLTNIYEYIHSGKRHDSYWLSATKIDYKICETCKKQEYQFHYDYDFSSIVLYETGELYSTRQPKLIDFCLTCKTLHCIHHACKT